MTKLFTIEDAKAYTGLKFEWRTSPGLSPYKCVVDRVYQCDKDGEDSIIFCISGILNMVQEVPWKTMNTPMKTAITESFKVKRLNYGGY